MPAGMAAEADKAETASQQYVAAMGQGWNLGNTFDGVDTNEEVEDVGETAWGNPVVTKELLQAVKAKGFDSVRMPMTAYRRYTEVDGKLTIDPDWLARYKEVIQWALDEDLYVMVNLHHDSWIWLSAWDGSKESPEYTRFVQLWEQLAEALKDMPEQVCFETINEPQFNNGTDEEKQAMLDELNLAAYEAIRNSGGNNATRMIVMPTMNTNHGNCDPLLALMQSLDDPNLIATVHYYSEWVFSANLGRTGFDEDLFGDGASTARSAAESMMDTVDKAFLQNGYGVIIGEYGLLGYDAGDRINQPGEELKYYETMGALARQYGVCLMLWDNGSMIDRVSGDYNWKKPAVGAMLEASLTGRSSYATGLDTLYFDEPVKADVSVPLTLNSNEFKGIYGLTEDTEYTWDVETATVTLKADYINGLMEAAEDYGTLAELKLQFSAGADWTEKLVKYAAPVFGTASGSREEGVTIPVTYNGTEIRRINAMSGSNATGPNSSWWTWLQNGGSYALDYEAGTLTLLPAFFAECAEGPVQLVIETYDGSFTELWLDDTGATMDRGISRSLFVQNLYLAAGAPAVEGWASYSDLAWNAWCRPAFTWAQNLGIIAGYPDGTAGLGDSLTREQAAAVLWNQAGRPETDAALDCTDAERISSYAKTAVAWALEQGILTCTEDGLVQPQADVTLAEAAALCG